MPADSSSPIPSTDPHLYEQLGQEISRLITVGTLRPGERIPSIRQLSSQRKVSITTVTQAYRSLENQGLIEARPQSGYYVRQPRWTPPPEPAVSLREPVVCELKVSELIMRVVRQDQHPSLVRLGAMCANMSYHTPPALHRSLAAVARRAAKEQSHCDRLEGSAEFRAQIARLAVKSGCTLSPGDIVTTTGTTEAQFLALRALAKPGDMIAIESPTYFGDLQLIESLGLRAIEIPTYPREGVCLDALAYALEHQKIRACLFTLNFHNPLGACMPDEKKRQLVELLARHQVPLIENDLYGCLAFGEQRPRTAKS